MNGSWSKSRATDALVASKVDFFVDWKESVALSTHGSCAYGL